METKTGFFEESPGVRSNMRLMCFMSLLAAIAAGMLILTKGATPGIDSQVIFLGFLTGAFAPKAIQKMTEMKDCEKKGTP